MKKRNYYFAEVSLLLFACFINHFFWSYSFNYLLQGGCLNGEFVNATPFRSSVNKTNAGDEETNGETLVDELGSTLIKKGFNYHGLEVLYSGVYGTELTCEIFIGPVYYQRLRHMVSDKYQVIFFCTNFLIYNC